MQHIGLGIVFLAGIISFLSPCVLPLVPAYLSYLAGTSIEEIKAGKGAKKKIFINSVMYVLGFAVVFSILGVLLNSVLANVSFTVRQWLGYVGGLLIIAFGLYLIKLIRIPWLEREHKLKTKFKPSYGTSFLFGAAFAVGWTPCVGAVLGAVLTLAVTNPASAFPLMLSYSLGLGLPFLIVGIFTAQSTKFIAKLGNKLTYFNYVVGVLLIILGILVFTQKLALISNLSFLNEFLLR